MPRKSAKSSANKASRYATTSIAAKPKPASPVIAPKEEEVEEVFVDPYSYYTSETLYFDEPLPEDMGFWLLCKWNSISSTSTNASCEVKLIGEEVVPSTKYKFVNLAGSARGFTRIFRAANIKFWGGNMPVEFGWVSPHDQGRITIESPADPNEVSKMYAYQITYKYLPADLKFEICHLRMTYKTFYVHVGSFHP
jgi:hypothetical protein